MNRLIKITALLLLVLFSTGCVYYNTFYHARKAFNDAESGRKKEEGKKRSSRGGYRRAAEKSLIVLEKHPNSKWYDDALYINGISNYYMNNFNVSEKRLRELLVNFPESQYIREARLYLAKARLKSNEEASAMVIFEELFLDTDDKETQTEAALALGEYYYENEEYEKAEPYFSSLIDSLGSDFNKSTSKMYIAEGNFARFRYQPALENYLDLLEYDLTTPVRYIATFRAGECYYYLNNIETGREYFNMLVEDELFYDSLAAVKLKIAWGYDWEGELELAEAMYEEIILENPRKPQAGLSNYSLGLIYQYDKEDYKKAREYYDAVKTTGRQTDIYQDALEHSANIAKLELYSTRSELDTSATIEEIDQAAETQYLLAELYLTQLNKSDSALNEFQYIVDEYPKSRLAPKALIAVGVMKRDFYDDTLVFKSSLRRVLADYPRSDFVPHAIDLLGLEGTIADSGYAMKYYEKAESFVFEKFDLDSARYYYRHIADSFPRSELNNKARFALLWLTENYDSPGDSSLYYEYAYFADSFPDDEFGDAAEEKLVIKPRLTIPEDDELDVENQDALVQDALVKVATTDPQSGDSVTERYISAEEKAKMGPDGETLFPVKQPPQRYDKQFIYPTAAYSDAFYGTLIFQIKIDAFGDVADAKLTLPSPSEALNDEAMEVILTAHFETFWIQAENMDSWFWMEYEITLPSVLR